MTDDESAGCEELLISLLEAIWFGPRGALVRHSQLNTVHSLDAVLEHRSVNLDEYVLADLDDQIWPHADDVSVVGRMVDLAETQAVGNDG